MLVKFSVYTHNLSVNMSKSPALRCGIFLFIGMWPNLARHLVWVQETASSNLVIPTIRVAEIYKRKECINHNSD